MSRTTLIVHISGTLRDFVAANVGEDGAYEDEGEYIRDLIRRDKERADDRAFSLLKAELVQAFAAPEEGYAALTAQEVIARNQA